MINQTIAVEISKGLLIIWIMFKVLIDFINKFKGMGFDAIWISPVVTNTPD